MLAGRWRSSALSPLPSLDPLNFPVVAAFWAPMDPITAVFFLWVLESPDYGVTLQCARGSEPRPRVDQRSPCRRCRWLTRDDVDADGVAEPEVASGALPVLGAKP